MMYHIKRGFIIITMSVIILKKMWKRGRRISPCTKQSTNLETRSTINFSTSTYTLHTERQLILLRASAILSKRERDV